MPGLLVFLMLAVVVSGVAVVYSKYLSRKNFVQLQTLRGERDRLDTRWSRLQLEQSSLATYTRVEANARNKLAMRLPQASEVIVLRED
jgi:cell division protein FtsL